MKGNWEDVANFLLRNRNIRDMVDVVLKSLDEVGQECDIFTVQNETHGDKKKKNKRRIKKLDVAQNQRLLQEYQSKKYVTQERKKELAVELNLSQVTIKNWFNNRRKREALRAKRNKMAKKIQQSGIRLNDYNVHKHPQMKNDRFMEDRGTTNQLSSIENVNVPCNLLVNDDIQITAVTKSETKLNYQKNLSGFVVIQDKNGICILHEL